MYASPAVLSRARIAAALLVVSAVGWSCSRSEPAPTAAIGTPLPDIVERSIAQHGFDRLDELELAFVVSSASGDFEVVAQHGDRFAFEVIARDGDNVRRHRHTNDVIEVFENGAPVALDDERARQRARDYVSARVYFLFPPYRLRDPSVRAEDLGIDDPALWEGRGLHRVRVTFEPGTSTNADGVFLYWFDPETARLEQYAYTYADGMRFRRLVDYRREQGLLLFDQENYGVDQEGVGIDDLDAAKVAALPHVSTVRLLDVVVRPRAEATRPAS